MFNFGDSRIYHVTGIFKNQVQIKILFFSFQNLVHMTIFFFFAFLVWFSRYLSQMFDPLGVRLWVLEQTGTQIVVN